MMKIKNISNAIEILEQANEVEYLKNDKVIKIEKTESTQDRFGQEIEWGTYNNETSRWSQIAWLLYYDRKYYHKSHK